MGPDVFSLFSEEKKFDQHIKSYITIAIILFVDMHSLGDRSPADPREHATGIKRECQSGDNRQSEKTDRRPVNDSQNMTR